MVRLISIATLIATAVTLTNAYSLAAWDANEYTGYQVKFSTQGKHSLGFKAKSYRWDRGVFDIGCCVNFCAGKKSTGGYCSSHSNNRVEAANQFDAVVLGCDDYIPNC